MSEQIDKRDAEIERLKAELDTANARLAMLSQAAKRHLQFDTVDEIGEDEEREREKGIYDALSALEAAVQSWLEERDRRIVNESGRVVVVEDVSAQLGLHDGLEVAPTMRPSGEEPVMQPTKKCAVAVTGPHIDEYHRILAYGCGGERRRRGNQRDRIGHFGRKDLFLGRRYQSVVCGQDRWRMENCARRIMLAKAGKWAGRAKIRE